jgi:hypothetical protein
MRIVAIFLCPVAGIMARAMDVSTLKALPIFGFGLAAGAMIIAGKVNKGRL